MEGTMVWFDPAKRHGFIRTVRFDRAADQAEEARAVNVLVVPLVAAQRARAHGRR